MHLPILFALLLSASPSPPGPGVDTITAAEATTGSMVLMKLANAERANEGQIRIIYGIQKKLYPYLDPDKIHAIDGFYAGFHIVLSVPNPGPAGGIGKNGEAVYGREKKALQEE